MSSSVARHWYEHRQAYAPPFARQLLESLAIAAVVWTLLASGLIFPVTWVTLTATFVGTFVTTSAWGTWRWRQWRRQHPIVPPAEVLRRRREAAPWN